MLVADSITSTRWGKPYFKGLGFCLVYGSLTIVLGNNETAKTALLEVLAGIKRPTSGQVRFEGQPVFGNDDYAKLVAHIGLKNDLHSRLTVIDNLRRFIPPSGAQGLAEAAIKYFRLEAFAATPCGMLPPHMQRRVAYARLIAVPCPLWLLHHKADSLDTEGNELFYMLVSNRCNQEGIVVIAAENADFISPNLPLNLDDF